MVYNGGDVTSHNGRKWKAQYWTKGDEPRQGRRLGRSGRGELQLICRDEKWGRGPHFLSCCVVGCLFPVREKADTCFVKGPSSGPFSWYITGSQRFLPQAEQQILLEGVGPLVGEGVALLALLARQPRRLVSRMCSRRPDPAPY